MRLFALFVLSTLVAGDIVPPLHGDGGQLIDAKGNKARLECASWSGAEQKDFVVGGLDKNSPREIVKLAKSFGLNCLRLPWSVQMALTNPKVSAKRLSKAKDLVGKRALEIFDVIIAEATGAGLVVMLDNHVSDANWCCSDGDGNGLWHTSNWPEEKWLEAWQLMAHRYSTNPRIVGAELRNEIRPAEVNGKSVNPTWGGYTMVGPDENFLTVPKAGKAETESDWAAAAERAAAHIHKTAPEWLIAVHGLDYAFVSAPLAALRPINNSLMQTQKNSLLQTKPKVSKKDSMVQVDASAQVASMTFTDLTRSKRTLQLPRKEKLMYVAHDFDWYHKNLTDYDSYAKRVDLAWGNTAIKGTAPVWVSEFGTPHDGVHTSSEGCFGGDEEGDAKLKVKATASLDGELAKMEKEGIDLSRMKEITGLSKDELVNTMISGEMKPLSGAIDKLKMSKNKKQSMMEIPTIGTRTLRKDSLLSLKTNSTANLTASTSITIPWEAFLVKAYTVGQSFAVKIPGMDRRKSGRKDCWWPYLMRYLKEHPQIGYSYWRLDGTESNGDGRVFGLEEAFGLMNPSWKGKSGKGKVQEELIKLHNNQM